MAPANWAWGASTASPTRLVVGVALLRQGGQTVEDEVQIADVIAHQHGAARARNVLRPLAVDLQVPGLEQRLGETDDGAVDNLSHGRGGPFSLPGKGTPGGKLRSR